MIHTAGGGQVLNLEDAGDWRAVVGGFLARILLGPLSWLGAVAIALHPGHETLPDHQALAAIKLTEQGAALLAPEALVTSHALPPTGACPCVTLEDSLHAVPTDETPVSVHEALGRLGVATLTPDVTLQYALSPTRLEEAPDVAHAAAALVALLEHHAIPPLPAAWSIVSLWRERVGHVALYPRVCVLEAADAAALDEVLAARGLDGALICRLSERSVLIDPDALPRLRGDLVARGYTPRLRRAAP
jgi:hypothetical protein